jgi:hypothetical protein
MLAELQRSGDEEEAEKAEGGEEDTGAEEESGPTAAPLCMCCPMSEFHPAVEPGPPCGRIVASSLCTTTHPLHTRLASTLGASVPEARMQLDPRSSRSSSAAARRPGRPAAR